MRYALINFRFLRWRLSLVVVAEHSFLFVLVVVQLTAGHPVLTVQRASEVTWDFVGPCIPPVICAIFVTI